MQTPWRFRTKRNLWAYAGLAVVTRSSSDHEFVAGTPVHRRRAPLTRGLNRNHNRVLKDVFKGAAMSVLVHHRDDPLYRHYQRLLEGGTKPTLARVTLARKLASTLLALWKKEEPYQPERDRSVQSSEPGR